MKRPGVIMLASVLVLALAACGGDDGGDAGAGDDGDGDGDGDGGDGETCYDVPTNQTNDGTKACGPVICAAGEYCVSEVGICDPGCKGELDCASGQFCDLSNAGADGVGLCRDPGEEHEVPCGDGGDDDCVERCLAKAATCGAPTDIASAACEGLCPMPEDQLACVEDTPCEELEPIFEGGTVCGIGGGD
jgi:hypothetical protein